MKTIAIILSLVMFFVGLSVGVKLSSTSQGEDPSNEPKFQDTQLTKIETIQKVPIFSKNVDELIQRLRASGCPDYKILNILNTVLNHDDLGNEALENYSEAYDLPLGINHNKNVKEPTEKDTFARRLAQRTRMVELSDREFSFVLEHEMRIGKEPPDKLNESELILKQKLGEEKYKQVLLTRQYGYSNILKLVERHSMDATKVAEFYAWKDEKKRNSNEIWDGGNVVEDAQKLWQQELKGILGPEAYADAIISIADILPVGMVESKLFTDYYP